MNWWVFVKCEPKSITIKRTKYLNYFSLCALNLFNTRVSQFELNYWNKWTFHLCTCPLIYLTHILCLHFEFAHNIPVHTKLSIVIYLYIQLSICILLFPIYLFHFYYFIIYVFCSVTVILLHWGSFCHENKFLVCVNITGIKLILMFSIMDRAILWIENSFKVTNILMDLFQTHSCSLHKTLIVGLELCGLIVDYYLAVWTFILTAPIHCRGSIDKQVM